MTNTARSRVFGYVRVSTENQLENYSIDEQVERLKGYCTAKGWILVKIYTDGGFSGGNIQRPALTQMLSDIRATPVDAVVVYKLDRLSRSQKDTLMLIEDEFVSHGVDFVSINENFDTSTPFGRAMIGILSVFAQLEKDQITERFTMGRIGRGKAGYYHGGSTPPTGYDYVAGSLVVNEYESLIVKEIYAMFLSGSSINAISRTQAEKYPLKFSAAKVRDILRNSVYIGRVKFAGQEYPGNHNPIIPFETFNAVQRLLVSPEREAKKTTAQKTPFRAGYLLSSLVFCNQCGSRYSANHGYYKCYSRSKSSPKFITDPNCRNDNWEISALDNFVIASIKRLIDDSDGIAQILAERKSAGCKPPDVDKIKAKISELENQQNNIINLYQVGTIPMEMVAERAEKLDAELRRLRAELDNTKCTSDETMRFTASLDAFMNGFDKGDTNIRRMYVSGLVEAVYIDGGTVNIKWRI